MLAYNEKGESDYSNIMSVTTLDPNAVPAPTGLNAQAVSINEISLNWQYGSQNQDGFRIERSTESSSYTQVGQTAAGDRTFHDTGLQPNTIYYYQVKASRGGDESPPSNEAYATTDNPMPVAPSNLQTEAVSSNRINLTWLDNSNNEDGFKIERRTEGGSFAQINQIGVGIVTYQDSELERNTIYYYRVSAYNEYGDSGYSNETSATTPDTPEAGEEQEFELGDTGVMITMCWIPEGRFWMGGENQQREREQDSRDNEVPGHWVTISNGFWMGKYEITQRQWEAVM